MAGESRKTTDHDTIRRWAEDRGGRPAAVRETGGGEDPGIIRIEFPEYEGPDEDLIPISWDEFFEKFEDKHLAMLYQEKTAECQRSNFYNFVERQ